MDRGKGWYEEGDGRVMGGGDEGRATREEASKDMPRGTHPTAVYPALFVSLLFYTFLCTPLLSMF